MSCVIRPNMDDEAKVFPHCRVPSNVAILPDILVSITMQHSVLNKKINFNATRPIATRNIGKLRYFGDVTNISYEKLVMSLICHNFLFNF